MSITEKLSDAKEDVERLRTAKGENEAKKRSIELIEPMIQALPLRRSKIEKLSSSVRNSNWMETKEDKSRAR